MIGYADTYLAALLACAAGISIVSIMPAPVVEVGAPCPAEPAWAESFVAPSPIIEQQRLDTAQEILEVQDGRIKNINQQLERLLRQGGGDAKRAKPR